MDITHQLHSNCKASTVAVRQRNASAAVSGQQAVLPIGHIFCLSKRTAVLQKY